jgi:Uma2 family endonuclease
MVIECARFIQMRNSECGIITDHGTPGAGEPEKRGVGEPRKAFERAGLVLWYSLSKDSEVRGDAMSTVLVRRWTRQEYERMVDAGVFPPGERVELIDGEVLKMTPQGSVHATAVRLTEDLLRAAFGPGHDVRVQMPLALDPSSEPEPDVAVVLGSPRDDRDAPPTSALLVVEVADTTLPYDREQKGSLYARAGVVEYWIVNLLNRVVEVYREPTSTPQARHGWTYRSVLQFAQGDHISPLAAPQARVAVGDLLP